MVLCPCGNGLLRTTKWGEICGICDYKLEHGEWDEFVVQIINDNGKNLFRIIFSDGTEEFGIGKDIGEAFNSIGLGPGALSAIDHYEIITPGHYRDGRMVNKYRLGYNYDPSEEDGLL